MPYTDASALCSTLSFVSLNVGGISSKFRYNILNDYIKKYDIALFSETKLQKIPQSEFPDYDIVTFKQKTRMHGLALLLKNDLFSYRKKLIGRSQCVLWFLLGSSECKLNFVMGSVYIPGYDSKFADQSDFDIISEDILTFREKYNCPFLLMGDFNSRTGNLSDSDDSSVTKHATPRVNADKKVDTYGRNLIKMCKEMNLKIVNSRYGSDTGVGNLTCHKPTGKSCVDYCIISDCLLPFISDFCVDAFDRCMSDVHSPICLDLKNIPVVKNEPLPKDNSEKIPYKSNWKPELKSQYQNSFVENDIMRLTENILNQQLSENPTKEEMERLVVDLTSVIVTPAKKLGLRKKNIFKKGQPRKSPHKSWFSLECENKRKKFFKAKNLVRRAKSTEEKERREAEMDREGKEYKKFISAHQNAFTRDLHKNLRKLHRHHPKEYWTILKNSDRTPISEPKISMADFEKHFKNLNEKDNSNNFPTHEFDPSDIDTTTIEEFNLEFTLAEVLETIKVLKNNKSEGVDYIKNEYLKNCPLNVVELIVRLFNLILRTGHVPSEWCIGLIVPIFKKKGSPFDANNYRGITLLSCLGKLFSMCINVRLTKFVTDRHIIGEEQTAFREGYSTMDNSFILNELINMYLHKKSRLYCCFIDYQKAFDTINRSALWGKIIENGINGKNLRVVYNMYEAAKSYVKQQSTISGVFACNMGVRQGENLSPLLFALFLNDFEISLSRKYNGLTSLTELSRILSTEDIDFFLNMYILLYADDTVVLAESPEEMQLALDEVGAYCHKWGLSINKTKTKVVIFSKGKVKKQHHFKIGNIDIDTDSEYCYLGTVFNFNGKFTKAINERITPARKAMFGLNQRAINLLLPPDIHIDLFEKMISPIFLYGCEVWGYGNLEPLEIFYRAFIKRVLGLGKSTPNCIVYGEVGKYPIAHRVFSRMISFWAKISEGEPTKLSSIMYRLIYTLHLNGLYNSPWLMCIKKILCDSGNPNFWFQQERLAPKCFMNNVVISQLDNQFIQGWEAEVHRNRRCIAYRIFKVKFVFEPYLSTSNFLDRRALSKFRSGSHTLPVTKARYKEGGGGVDVKCKLCNNDFCDEYHVLFVCTHFTEQRKKYLKKYYMVKPNTFKMHALFNSYRNDTNNLAKFIRHILLQFA